MNGRLYVGIGREYKEAFDSIYKLAEKRKISNKIVTLVRDGNTIETPNYIFAYTGETEAINTGAQIGMFGSGASWFMGFRGGETDNTMSAWFDFVEAVAAFYHREYSFVEYVQDTTMHSEAEVSDFRKRITRVAEKLSLPVSRIELAKTEDSIEDIYVVSLRMEIVYGVGEPQPVLCKMYFRHRNGVFTPIHNSEAEKSEEYINSVIEKQNDYDRPSMDGANESEIIDSVLNAIEKLVKDSKKRNFSENILIADPVDKAAIQKLISDETGSAAQVECKKLKVLGISHIRWIDTAFDLYSGSQKMFLVKVSPGNSMSWYCCCGSEDNQLIENDTIICKSAGITSTVAFNFDDEELGISEETVEKIKNESAFSKHAVPIICSELARRKIQCKQYRCESNTVIFETNDGPKRKCADCPYPEVVLRYGDGETAYTPMLSFDTATLQPVAAKTVNCKYCRRPYTESQVGTDFQCAFCAHAFSSCDPTTPEGRDAHARYKKYAGMLPLSARIGAKGKYCFENEDRILFVVGKNKYFFDKLELNDTGMIESPKKH